MGKYHGRIGDKRRPGVPLPAPPQMELATLLAECLIADMRDKVMVKSPRGIDRGTRNPVEDNGQASERGWRS